VPALLNERIIGVTDPEDDTLVIWGVIREGEPPKQLVAGGEFFVLKKVERVEKVRSSAVTIHICWSVLGFVG
jgi:cytochrome c oxidase subunit 5b